VTVDHRAAAPAPLWALIVMKALTDPVWFSILSFLPDFHRAWPPAGQARPPRRARLRHGRLRCAIKRPSPRPPTAAGLSAKAARKCSLLIYACLIVPVPLVRWLHNPWAAAALLGLALFTHQGFFT